MRRAVACTDNLMAKMNNDDLRALVEAQHFAALGGALPDLMVTDPPYGVNYDPEWRHRAGVNNSSRTERLEGGDRQHGDEDDHRRMLGVGPGQGRERPALAGAHHQRAAEQDRKSVV